MILATGMSGVLGEFVRKELEDRGLIWYCLCRCSPVACCKSGQQLFNCNFHQPEEVAASLPIISHIQGGFSTLLLMAGVDCWDIWGRIDYGQFSKVASVNALSQISILRAALDQQRGINVVLISSNVTKSYHESSASYSASKVLLELGARMLFEEFDQKEFRIAIIRPPFLCQMPNCIPNRKKRDSSLESKNLCDILRYSRLIADQCQIIPMKREIVEIE